MFWRSAIVAGYLALAIVIGIAYGWRGLAILSFFYFYSGAWAAFALVWGAAARAAGRWNFERMDTPIGDGRSGRPHGEPAEPSEAPEIVVERDSDPVPAPERRRPVPVL